MHRLASTVDTLIFTLEDCLRHLEPVNELEEQRIEDRLMFAARLAVQARLFLLQHLPSSGTITPRSHRS